MCKFITQHAEGNLNSDKPLKIIGQPNLSSEVDINNVSESLENLC